jgi:hypothetical protein
MIVQSLYDKHGNRYAQQNMLFCDFCGYKIPPSTEYRCFEIPEHQKGQLFAKIAASGGLKGQITINSDGSMRLDVCLGCLTRCCSH